MAKVDNLRRINTEDFPQEYSEFVDRLAFTLNPFLEQVVDAFDGKISTENLTQEDKEIIVTVDSSGIPTTTTKFINGLSGKIKGIRVIRAFNQTNSSVYPTTAPFISFEENSKVVSIKHITGLQANNKYKLVIRTEG